MGCLTARMLTLKAVQHLSVRTLPSQRSCKESVIYLRIVMRNRYVSQPPHCRLAVPASRSASMRCNSWMFCLFARS